MFQKKMFKTLHQNRFLHDGKPSFQFLTLTQNSLKELKIVSLISLLVNFYRVQTTMSGKNIQQPQPPRLPKQSPPTPSSTSQAKNPTGQLVPLPSSTLANQYLVSTIPKPNYQRPSLGQPSYNLALVSPTPKVVTPYTVDDPFGPIQSQKQSSSSSRKGILLTSKNHLSSTYPILNVIQFTCPKDGISSQTTKKKKKQTLSSDVHEIYTIKYSHIYIFSLTFMLFCD